MKTKISFVDTSQKIKKVKIVCELERLLSECRSNNIPLKNLDLSGLDIENIDMGGVKIQNVIFNAFDVKRSEPKLIFNVSFKGSELSNVSFAQCKFVRCNFDTDKNALKEEQKNLNGVSSAKIQNDCDKTTRIENVDFFLCEFDLCRFRNTCLKVVDFRYSDFTDCSLGGCRVEFGDFYMAAFKGTTNFIDSKFIRCSITNALFENNLLRIKSIEGLVQEYYDDYSHIFMGDSNWYKQNPCADFSCLIEVKGKSDSAKSKAFIRNEASSVYAQLSGYYAGKGFYRDSNKAYGRAKINEAWSNMYTIVDSVKSICKGLADIKRLFGNRLLGEMRCIIKSIISLLGFVFSWLFGFGYRIWFVFLWFVVIVLGYMGALHFKAKETLCWDKELAYSLNNTIGPFEKFTDIFEDDLIACLQTTSGILLIGFLGFVLANRIRNNY